MSVTRLRRSVGALTGRGRGRVLASVSVGWFLLLGMRFVVPSILPTITEGFGASDSQAGLAITVLWVTYAAMQFPAGYYADRLGERVLLTGGLIISAVGLLAYPFTPTFALFVVVTGIFGLGTGLFGPPRGTVISKTYDENDGAAFGAMLGAGSLGAALLPAVAALALATLGWRVTLAAAAPVLFVAAVATWWVIPDTRRNPGRAHEPIRVVLRQVAAAVRDWRVALAAVGSMLMLFAFQGVTAFLTTYLVDVKGFSQATAGTLLGVLFLVGATSQVLGGGLADRFGTPRVLFVISLLSTVPLFAVPMLDGRLALAVASAAIGVRMSIGPVSNAYIIDLLPDATEGSSWGALRTVLFLAGSFGSTLVGYMADAQLFDAAFYVLGAITASVAVLYLFLPERS
ncbi:MAG: MFS transporter [Haloarculaceae archaeon]